MCLSLPLLFSYPSMTSSLCFCFFLRLPSSLDPTVSLFPLNSPLVIHLLCSYTFLTPFPMISPPNVSLHIFVPICPALLSAPSFDICSTFFLSLFASVYPSTTSLILPLLFPYKYQSMPFPFPHSSSDLSQQPAFSPHSSPLTNRSGQEEAARRGRREELEERELEKRHYGFRFL